MTPWEKHKSRWIKCRRCTLSERRRNVVLLRGNIPCDVLFIGEAPGESEDVLAKPFIGPAGKLLDSIIRASLVSRTLEINGKLVEYTPRHALTNLVGCIPRDEENLKAGEPPKVAIETCAPRLVEVTALCQPKLIVMVGRLSEKWAPQILGFEGRRKPVKTLAIYHPAAMLRMDISQKGLAIQRTRVALTDAVDALYAKA